jgi:hypothetical protein
MTTREFFLLMNPSLKPETRRAVLKTAIKEKFPALVPLYSYLHRKLVWQPHLRRVGPQAIFTQFYHDGSWGSSESRSGRGSTMAATTNIRAVLPQMAKDLGVRVLLDIPCGDMNWMRSVPLDLDLYIGADIVPEIIERNHAMFAGDANPPRQFLHLDLTRDPLPKADLVLCRDCLIHLSFRAALDALANIKRSGARYLLTTTFLECENVDIATGEFRPINLAAPPFNFPPPLQTIQDSCPDLLGNEDKRCGLWRVADLPS